MTKSEDNERGVLTVSVNYAKFAQHLNGLIYFAGKVRDDLEQAALEKKIKRPKEDNGAWPT